MKPDIILYTKRKSFGLEIDDEAKLIVRVPKDASKFEIEKLIEEKKEWILKKRKEALSKKPIDYKYEEGELFYFLGKKYPLNYVDTTQKTDIIFTGSNFLVEKNKRKETKSIFTAWYKDKALHISKFITNKYSVKLGENYNKVKISNAKTRWGSCNTKGNINISWRLVLAPLQVLDYVIAHETAHLKYMDHSKKFWKTVEELNPEYKTYRQWLKDNSHLLKF